MEDNYDKYLNKKGVKDKTFAYFKRYALRDSVNKSQRRHEDKEYKRESGPGSASFRRYQKSKALKNKMK